MPRPALWLLVTIAGLLAGSFGCAPNPTPRTANEQAMFGAVSFRIHPAFTQVKEWSGQHKPDGIEAVLEFQDQFGDPTRAAGEVRFELYSFLDIDPTHRGGRMAMWTTSLDERDDQIAHWDPAARGYSFQLTYPTILPSRTYVLTAQFDRNNTRLFDQLIIEPTTKENPRGDRRTQHAPPGGPGRGGF